MKEIDSVEKAQLESDLEFAEMRAKEWVNIAGKIRHRLQLIQARESADTIMDARK